MIYLYVKTHNKTGLKYLGKTKSKDPHIYRGSGKLWTNHIKKHGYDVTTEILFQSESNEEIKQQGLYYSKLWNIVESKEWANLKEESGDGGFDQYALRQVMLDKYGVENASQVPEIYERIMKNRTNTLQARYGVDNASQIPEVKIKLSNSTTIGLRCKDLRNYARKAFVEKYGVNNASQVPEIKNRIKRTFAENGHQQGNKNSQYGTMWITDGVNSRKIKKTDEVPEGWHKGRKM